MTVGPEELRRRAAVARTLFWTALAVGFAVWFVLTPAAVERRWLAAVAALVVGSTAFAVGLLRRPNATRGKPDAWTGAAVAAGLAPVIGHAPPLLYMAGVGIVATACALVAGISWREARQLKLSVTGRTALEKSAAATSEDGSPPPSP